MEEYCIVITTTNKDNSREIAKALVERRLAACVQMSDIDSVYEWNGEVCFDNEVLVLIKTRSAIFEEVKRAIESAIRFFGYQSRKLVEDGAYGI